MPVTISSNPRTENTVIFSPRTKCVRINDTNGVKYARLAITAVFPRFIFSFRIQQEKKNDQRWPEFIYHKCCLCFETCCSKKQKIIIKKHAQRSYQYHPYPGSYREFFYFTQKSLFPIIHAKKKCRKQK